MRRIVLAVAVLLAPCAARADVSIGIEATLSAPRLGISRVPGSTEPLSAAGDLGGNILVRLHLLGFGVAAERTVHGTGRLDTRSAMAGLVTDLLPIVRLELLGELGNADSPDGLARFRGARPGLSLKAPGIPLRVGVWGLARWGLPGKSSGPSYGMLARVGIEL
jgi:hypothetical protein